MFSKIKFIYSYIFYSIMDENPLIIYYVTNYIFDAINLKQAVVILIFITVVRMS